MPTPLLSETTPPVVVAAVPAIEIISPPVFVALSPPLSITAPVLPFAPFEVPVLILIDPLLPLLVVPDLKCKEPLTPAVPASADLITINPEDFALPDPELSEINPPVPLACVVDPACANTEPETV